MIIFINGKVIYLRSLCPHVASQYFLPFLSQGQLSHYKDVSPKEVAFFFLEMSSENLGWRRHHKKSGIVFLSAVIFDVFY